MPGQTCLKRSCVSQSLLMIRQNSEESRKLSVPMAEPIMLPRAPSLPPSQFLFLHPNLLFMLLPRILPQVSAKQQNVSAKCFSSCSSVFPKALINCDKFSHSSQQFQCRNMFHNSLLILCIRKRLQGSEWSLRGTHEARHLMKAGTIGS